MGVAEHRAFTFATLETALKKAAPDDLAVAIRYANRCISTTPPQACRIYEALRLVLQFELTHGDPNRDCADEIAAEVSDWLFGDEEGPQWSS